MAQRKHWIFDVFLALIAKGNSAEEAKRFILDTIPNINKTELVAILDNMGDIAKAEDDYANKIMRSKIAGLKDGNGPREELASRMFAGVTSDG